MRLCFQRRICLYKAQSINNEKYNIVMKNLSLCEKCNIVMKNKKESFSQAGAY